MTRVTTMNDFMRYVLTAFPEAAVEEDYRTGELIILTNFKINDEQVVRLDNEKPF